MKKILLTLLLVTFTITGIFADYEQEAGTVDTSSSTLSSETAGEYQLPFNSPKKINLKSTINSISYTATITYGSSDVPSANSALSNTTIEGFTINDSSLEQMTETFGMIFEDGNFQDPNSYKLTVEPSTFIRTTDEFNSTVQVKVLDVTNYAWTTDSGFTRYIEKTVDAGYNETVDIAAFKLGWQGKDDLAAGTYKATITLKVTSV